MGAVDESSDVFDAIGSKEPTGTITADFLENLHNTYASEYGAVLECVRIDNGSVFDCAEFRARAAKLFVRIELIHVAAYFHWQLRIERHWRTMKRDGACMLGFCGKPKSFFIHACLHAVMVRCVTRAEPSDDEAEDAASISTYARLTGGTFPLSAIRIFGANAYGTMVPEQRQQLRLDKADKYAVYGT